MAVTVKKERGKGGKAFWGLPGLLGQEPGLWLEKKEDALSGSTHHASCFLAWEDGQPAARIFVDKSAELSRKRGEPCALFGLLMGKKQEAVQAVLEAAEREARRLGAARLLGPLHPGTGSRDAACFWAGNALAAGTRIGCGNVWKRKDIGNGKPGMS